MPLSEAKKIWEKTLQKNGFLSKKSVEFIAVDDCLGRVTAEPVFAFRSSPSYNGAAMDGIAIRFTDLSAASEASPVRLQKGQYAPVNTGNSIPREFNAVVMIKMSIR